MRFEAIIAMILLAIVIASMSGCKVMSEWIATDEQAVQYTVMAATAKVIDGEAEKRDRVIEVSENIRKYVSGNPETPASKVADMVREQVRWDSLTPLQAKIVGKLIDEIEERIVKARQGNLIESDKAVTLVQVLDWVEQAAYEADVDG